jgi:U3 small nucleolar RNA-associated protein 6
VHGRFSGQISLFSRSWINRSLSRALQLHPGIPALYVLAAAHELDHASPTAARALLQRGIRLNPESVDMWKEYIKMELNFVESMRRRWEVLGIDVEQGSSGAVPNTDEDAESASARKEIMAGAIIKAVMDNAVKGMFIVLFCI